MMTKRKDQKKRNGQTRRRYRDDPMRWWRINMRWRYRVSDEFLDFLLTEARCEICGKGPGVKKLAVDHCHKTGRVRGILCVRCNSALGMFGDDIISLHNAVSYLLKNLLEGE